MKVSRIAILLSMVLFLMAGTCSAGQSQAGSQCKARFDTLDKDHDGKLTLEEFQAGAINPAKAKQRFDSLDTSNKGYLIKECIAEDQLQPMSMTLPSTGKGGAINMAFT